MNITLAVSLLSCTGFLIQTVESYGFYDRLRSAISKPKKIAKNVGKRARKNREWLGQKAKENREWISGKGREVLNAAARSAGYVSTPFHQNHDANETYFPKRKSLGMGKMVRGLVGRGKRYFMGNEDEIKAKKPKGQGHPSIIEEMKRKAKMNRFTTEDDWGSSDLDFVVA